MIWLGLIAQPFYQAQFGFPPGEEPRLTYLAAMDRRPILLTAMDMAWGMALGALTTLISVWAARKWR